VWAFDEGAQWLRPLMLKKYQMLAKKYQVSILK